MNSSGLRQVRVRPGLIFLVCITGVTMATFVLVFGGGSAWGGILILASVSCFVYCIGSISCAWNGALFWDLSTTPKIRSNGSTVESFVVHLRCGGLICNLELTQDQRETLIYQLRLES